MKPVRLLVVTALLGAWIAPAVPCGFDGLLGDGFGAMHPKSIDVAFAIRAAVKAGAIDKAATDPIVPGSAGYWRAIGHLNAFRHRLSPIAGDTASIAVLLIDLGLWTRLTRNDSGYDIAFHAAGAEPGDTVLVTNETVLTSILERHLAADAAIKRGLMAVDGTAAARVSTLITSMRLDTKMDAARATPAHLFGTPRAQ